jgi:hypothetical protein
MRLLSFVPCGCRAGPIDDAPPTEHAGDAAAAARRRRRRRRAAAAAAAQQWRPSLGDIYEEHSTDAAKVGAGGQVTARKAASWDVARVLPRSDEYRYIATRACRCHISLDLPPTCSWCANPINVLHNVCTGTLRAHRPCRRSRRRRSCSDHDGVGVDHQSVVAATTAYQKYYYCLKHIYRLLSTYCRTKDLYASVIRK